MNVQSPMANHWAATKAAPGLFNAEECGRIIALRDSMAQESATTSTFGSDKVYRESQISWIRLEEKTRWIFEKTNQIINRVNQSTYKMDLAGFGEPLQLATYRVGHHYNWHIDTGGEESRAGARKLSFIVQLSMETDYEGGEVQVRYGPDPLSLQKTRGTFIVFPSYVLHRVQPIVRGERLSLVGWMAGPPFR